ncbi:hypothetical protein [Dongia deserti]|uniref:hypothetical protein n=1 Tax=Dongia deserti TaxID=2268030 RepID=UPI000E6460FE|nr:hypothetical protein [Dongia deserti]
MLKLNLLALAMFAIAAAPVHAQTSTSNQVPTSLSPDTTVVGVPGCHFGEKIDSTTADDAQRILSQAGYTSISGLTKGCDNYWHGQAMFNGVMTNVMVTPDGRVVQEGS